MHYSNYHFTPQNIQRMIANHYYPSPAKLNLFLFINQQRPDGYHELQTLFQLLNYGDWLQIKSTENPNIQIQTSFKALDNQNNLIYRAAILLQQYTSCKLGAEIVLDKILPMGGGLGGGSSNAATTLIVLNQLWNTQLTVSQLMDIGKTLGADVPLFILGQTAFAEGIGEKLMPTQQPSMYYLVVKPDISINTRMLFQHPQLTRDTPKKMIDSIAQQDFRNDCEKIVKQLYPEVEYWINWLVQYAPARLTGTGACIFAEFRDYESANNILKKIPNNIRAFIAEGINTSPLYWKNSTN